MAGKLKKYYVEILLVLFICTFLAGQSVYFLHYKIVDEKAGRFYTVLHWQVINKKAKAPSQYRPLSFWMAEIITPEINSTETKSPPSNKSLTDAGKILIRNYLHLRFLFTLLSAMVIYLLSRQFLSPAWSFGALVYFFALLPITYQGYMHQPHDPPNLFIYCLAYLLINYGYSAWLLPLILIGMPNRETVMLLPILDVISRFDERPTWKPAIRFILYSIAALGLYYFIHKYYGPRERGQLPFITLGTNLEHPDWFYPFAYIFGPLIVITLLNIRSMPSMMKRWLVFGTFFIIFHVVLGRFREVRLLLPVLPLFVISTCISLRAFFGKTASEGTDT